MIRPSGECTTELKEIDMRLVKFTLVFAFVLVGLFGVARLRPARPATYTAGPATTAQAVEEDLSAEAYVMAQGYVKHRLRTPGTADFAGFLEARRTMTRTSGQVYSFDTWV